MWACAALGFPPDKGKQLDPLRLRLPLGLRADPDEGRACQSSLEMTVWPSAQSWSFHYAAK